ncbi:MAG TPA: hypothetical protein H9875_08600 [Candidatus Levilactobacillus faecigallinarum]|uniref:Uncharacterized protein n=1 Tax=Candidatus Levilactobacillus faecigallinarum TaxID=2838638 RepID=A0A9D1QUS1_9LACO|nr:hypothetical protein [Candidatus Levilactobacillus faecigallinarum]
MELAVHIQWWKLIPWKEISTYLVPLVSILASYLIGRIQSSNSQRNDVRQKRYEQLYLPVIRDLIESGYWRTDPQVAHKSIATDFYPMLSQHIELMGNRSAIAFINFEMPLFTYKVDLGLLLDSHKNPKETPYKIPQKDKDAYNIAFLSLVAALLAESSQLAHKLKFPDLSETISSSFDLQMHKWLQLEDQDQN